MSVLSPPRLYALDAACRPIREAFGGWTYLVGSVQERKPGPLSDVDVRLILSDKKYDRLFGKQGAAFRTVLDLAFSAWLGQQTGLPVDFQIQRRTEANAIHAGKQRNPLGVRSLSDWRGDATPADVRPPEPDPDGYGPTGPGMG